MEGRGGGGGGEGGGADRIQERTPVPRPLLLLHPLPEIRNIVEEMQNAKNASFISRMLCGPVGIREVIVMRNLKYREINVIPELNMIHLSTRFVDQCDLKSKVIHTSRSIIF